MKVCGRCKIEKEESEFGFKDKSKNKLQYFCKQCNKEYNREHYQKNKQDYLDKAKRNDKIYKDAQREWTLEYLREHPCIDCGEVDPIVLHFDHVRGNKSFNISTALCGVISLDKLREEVKKCDVRCANCHMRKTARDFGWYRHTNAAPSSTG